MSRIARTLLLLLPAGLSFAGNALAQEQVPTDPIEHYVAMRSFLSEDAPRLILATSAANEERAVPIQGCDGNTYYLTADDGGLFQEALNIGDTVQLHAGPSSSPDTAAIVCLFQAAQ